MKRSRRLAAGLGISMFVLAGCGSATETADVAEEAPSSTAPASEVTEAPSTTTSTASTTTTSTTTSTTTTTVVEEVLPLEIEDPADFIDEALDLTFTSGAVDVRVESRTGSRDSAGRLVDGELIYVVNQWDGDEMSGFASFNGLAGISARGDGNSDLIAALLLFGSTYSYDGEWLVAERQLFHTVSDDISSEGGDWVKVRTASLDEQQQFALRLLAPYMMGKPFETSEPDKDDVAEELHLVERRGDWSTYSYTFSSPDLTSESEFVIDGEGRLRESRNWSDMFRGTEQVFRYYPMESADVRAVRHEQAEDVTEQFAAYATARYSTNPDSLGG